MSTVIINSIQGLNSGTVADVNDLKFQLATAWVNFSNNGALTIRDSYNVSSVTDVAVGVAKVNFATAMDNVNYAPALAIEWTSTNAGGNLMGPEIDRTTRPTVNDLSVACHYGPTTALYDVDTFSVIVYGGKN